MNLIILPGRELSMALDLWFKAKIKGIFFLLWPFLFHIICSKRLVQNSILHNLG